MIQITFTVQYDPTLNGMDRVLDAIAYDHPVSVDLMFYSFSLLNQNTAQLLIPENDGKQFTSTIDGMTIRTKGIDYDESVSL